VSNAIGSEAVTLPFRSVHLWFATLRLTGGMRIPAESTVARLAHRLGLALSVRPIGRPDPVDVCHWYAVWQGDAVPD
jgi:hypothetical protein